MLETNDSDFFPPASISVATSNGKADARRDIPVCLWKIVRDLDAREELVEASVVMSDNLLVYSMGPACIVAAERDRKEILAFLGIEVTAQFYRDSIYPILLRLTEFVTHSVPRQHLRAEEGAFVGGGCNA